MKHNFIIWIQKEKPKLRDHMKSDSDPEQPEVFFHGFIILESREVLLTKLSPFLIQKVMSSMVNPKSVKKTLKKKNETS